MEHLCYAELYRALVVKNSRLPFELRNFSNFRCKNICFDLRDTHMTLLHVNATT